MNTNLHKLSNVNTKAHTKRKSELVKDGPGEMDQ